MAPASCLLLLYLPDVGVVWQWNLSGRSARIDNTSLLADVLPFFWGFPWLKIGLHQMWIADVIKLLFLWVKNTERNDTLVEGPRRLLYSFSKPNLRSCYYVHLKIKGKQRYSDRFSRLHSDWKKEKKKDEGERKEGGGKRRERDGDGERDGDRKRKTERERLKKIPILNAFSGIDLTYIGFPFQPLDLEDFRKVHMAPSSGRLKQ